MTTTTAQPATPALELSCREAHLVLRLIPLRKPVTEMTEEEIAAIRHYLLCKSCRDQGLAGIVTEKLSCKEVILIWAEHACALWLHCSFVFGPRIHTLAQLFAVEHVWGKYEWKNAMGGEDWKTATACRNRSCRELHSYWTSIPMSTSAGDGPKCHLLVSLALQNISAGAVAAR